VSLLSDYRAEELGITFHRNKTIDALLRSMAGGSVLIDLLLSITRPAEKKPKPIQPAVPKPVQGMVHYQTGVGQSLAPGLRELHGPEDDKTS
jgi:hypothetical protein